MSSILPVRKVNDEWDVAFARTLAGTAFGGSNVVPAVVGQFSYSQIWNPTTTRILIVTAIDTGTTTGNTGINIYRSAGMLLNPSMVPASKRIDGGAAPASLAQIRYENNALFFPNPADLFHSGICLAWTPLFYRPVGGTLTIMPGFGVTVVNVTQNQDMQVSYEFYERNL